MGDPLLAGPQAELNVLGLNKSRKKKKIIALALAGLIVVGGGIGTYEVVNTPKATQSMIRYYTVQRGDVTETVTATGTVQAANSFDLSFSGNSGKITAVNVKVGDHVKAGQVLATLDSRNQQSQVANAQANLDSAEAKLQQAQEGPLAATIQSEQANLEAAKAKLDQLKQGATPEAIAVQQTNVDKAKIALDGAKTSYANLQATLNDKTTAQQQIASAQNQVAQAAAQLKSAQAGLDAANARLAAAQEGPSQADLNAAQQAVANAQTQVYLLQSQLDNAPVGQLDSISQQYNNAVANLANAQKALADLKAQPDPNAVAQAQAAVTQAQAAVEQAQNSYNSAKQNLNIVTAEYNDQTSAKQQLDNAQNAIDQAQANYNNALAQLQQLKAPTDKATLEAAQAAVDQAQAQLQQTMATPDAATIKQAQAAVTQAQAQLQQQQTALDDLVLKAPIDGIVTAVNGKVGEYPTNNTAVISMDDSNSGDLQISAAVSQTDIGKIKTGQDATFTTSSFQGKTFKGKVLMVSPQATTTNGVTTYTVLLSVSNPDGLLKTGMSTNVTITVGSHQNVLYIPSLALKELNGKDGVYVSNNSNNASASSDNQQRNSNSNKGQQSLSNLKFQPIQIGYYSTDKVEVTSGLNEGDRIAVVMQIPSTTTSNTRGQGIGIMGGFGGGGFGGGGYGGGFGGNRNGGGSGRVSAGGSSGGGGKGN